MMNDLTYKGYTGSVSVSFEDDCLYGNILYINDLITYEAETPAGIQRNFEEAVDRYLEYCSQNNQNPDKPFSGTFNVRTGAELHKKATVKARIQGKSLNEFVVFAISDAVSGTSTEAINKAFDMVHSKTLYSSTNKQESQVMWS